MFKKIVHQKFIDKGNFVCESENTKIRNIKAPKKKLGQLGVRTLVRKTVKHKNKQPKRMSKSQNERTRQ